MQYSASLLVPTFRRTWALAIAMPAATVTIWLAAAVAGVAADVAIDRYAATGNWALILYGMLLCFLQVWITREAFERNGVVPAMSMANSLSLYLQGLLIGIGIMFASLLLILPGLYVFARWYLASTLLIRDEGGRRAAMRRSWDMLAVQWPTALGVGAILFLLSVAPLVLEFANPGLAEGAGFGWLVATNLVSSVGVVGGYLAAVALLLNIEQPASTLQEIFS